MTPESPRGGRRARGGRAGRACAGGRRTARGPWLGRECGTRAGGLSWSWCLVRLTDLMPELQAGAPLASRFAEFRTAPGEVQNGKGSFVFVTKFRGFPGCFLREEI